MKYIVHTEDIEVPEGGNNLLNLKIELTYSNH